MIILVDLSSINDEITTETRIKQGRMNEMNSVERKDEEPVTKKAKTVAATANTGHNTAGDNSANKPKQQSSLMSFFSASSSNTKKKLEPPTKDKNKNKNEATESTVLTKNIETSTTATTTQQPNAAAQSPTPRSGKENPAVAIVPKAVPSSAMYESLHDKFVLVRKPRKRSREKEETLRTSVAAFDLDGTLLQWASDAPGFWPSQLTHYELWNHQVITQLRHLYDKEHRRLVIFTNQGGIQGAHTGKKAALIKSLLDWLEAMIQRPLLVIASTKSLKKYPNKSYHKPTPNMWKKILVPYFGKKQYPFDVASSFFVGDSAGGDDDPQGGVDKKFAAHVGLRFYEPREYFGPSNQELRQRQSSLTQDVGDDGVVVHPTPLPDNNPKSFLSQLARYGNKNCVLYLCCFESTKDFINGLKKCELSCGNSDQKQNLQRDGRKIHAACFQRDGTRHISLWQGQLSTKKAKTIIDRCHNKNISKIPITHVQFTDGWNNWKSGNYLGLDKSTTTDPLRVLKSTILSGIVTSTNMGKPNCDHLSLYRQRGQSKQDVTDAFACVRTALHDHHWGKLPVHSIRLKILGGEYDECKVLMSSSLSSVQQIGGQEDDIRTAPSTAMELRNAIMGGYYPLHAPGRPMLLLLAGVQGSGKSTFARYVLYGKNSNTFQEKNEEKEDGHTKKTTTNWACFSQDTINNGKPGKREKVFEQARHAILEGQSVIIDRMHLDSAQRQVTLDEILSEEIKAMNVGVHVVLLNPQKDLIIHRVSTRTNHPAKVEGQHGVQLASLSLHKLVVPTYQEKDLDLINCASTEYTATQLALRYHNAVNETNSNVMFESMRNILVPKYSNLSSHVPGSFSIPSISLGTMKIGRRNCVEIVQNMISEGLFRSIDTAPTYKNEDKIGEVLNNIDIKTTTTGDCDDIFIIAKVPKRATDALQVREEFHKTLQNLNRNHVDLLLLHWPNDVIALNTLKEVWECMESFVQNGKCKALGVCNFNERALVELLRTCTVPPIINQVERHPLLPQHQLVDFCARNNILVQAHTTLGQGRDEILENSTILTIANENECTPAQVVTLWNLQAGQLVVTKCTQENHAKEILSVIVGSGTLLDCSSSPEKEKSPTIALLSPHHMKALDAMGDGTRFIAPPFMYSTAIYCWGERMPTMMKKH